MAESGFEAPDRVFAGTHVFSGTAEAVVTATGMATELGRIAGLTQSAEHRPSPLEIEMQRVTRVVAMLSIAVGVTFFAVAGALGMPLTERFLFAIGVIVANVPEGLLPTVTLSLALATQRMARRNAIVRRLSSVETLGCTTVICTDKTGTLTTNEMTVRRLWTPDGSVEVEGVGYQPEGTLVPGGASDPEAVTELVRGGALCNDATLDNVDGAWRVIGDPTEGALLTLALQGGARPGAGRAPLPAPGRGAVRLRPQAHDHGAREPVRPDGLRQGRARVAGGTVDALRRRPHAARSPPRTSSRATGCASSRSLAARWSAARR